ncbi:Lsr2 family protein [Arthrobacter sp. NQ7]|uniref:histone-like nucleoid-structuring protein Lsr2 n=1 Tax=Arthrobacter sp. NQ7 TaxID=3032303 RepID=UPI00240FEEAB|nr:Lsr2 family protein [Arthrobacter sp. NQ7]MDJ0459323.1 Lsr2 family protein [Arthrobacter sp. NQ7]
MATRTVIELIDDLDGSEATETLRFGLDGTDYEIDLAGQNAAALRGVLTRYAQAARKEKVGRAAAVRQLPPAADTKAVRAWAGANGIEVNPRGRIREDVVQRYLASLS